MPREVQFSCRVCPEDQLQLIANESGVVFCITMPESAEPQARIVAEQAVVTSWAVARRIAAWILAQAPS